MDFKRTVMDTFVVGLTEEKRMVVGVFFITVNMQKCSNINRLFCRPSKYNVRRDKVKGSSIKCKHLRIVLVADPEMSNLEQSSSAPYVDFTVTAVVVKCLAEVRNSL